MPIVTTLAGALLGMMLRWHLRRRLRWIHRGTADRWHSFR
jgi:hypothetical protein